MQNLKQKLTLLFLLCLSEKVFAEAQTTLNITAPALTIGNVDTFSASQASGPAGSNSGTFLHSYAGVVKYTQTAGTGRFAAFNGAVRYGVEFDTFQIFQSFLTNKYFTVVSSGNSCPSAKTYNWLMVRYRTPDTPVGPMNATSNLLYVGGTMDYDTSVFTGVNYFNLDGPTLESSPTYGFTGMSGATCSSGKYLAASTGTSSFDPYAQVFFGTNAFTMVTNLGSPEVIVGVPQQTLSGGSMSTLGNYVFTGLYTSFDSKNTQTQKNVYLYPDSNGTTWTLKEATSLTDPFTNSTLGTLTCTSLNLPTTGFCSGTLELQGVGGSGKAVCEIFSDSAENLMMCTAQKPNNTTLPISIIAKTVKQSALQVSLPVLPAEVTNANDSTTVTVTLKNLSSRYVATLGNPSDGSLQLAAPWSNNNAFGGGNGTCGTSLKAYSSCTFDVTYNPSSVGTNSRVLRVAYDNGATTVNSTGVLVGTAALTSITLSPGLTNVSTGGTQQITATAHYSDNSTQNVTSVVAWGSDNAAIAAINSSGLASWVAGGSVTLTATLGSVSANVSPTVVDPPLLTSISNKNFPSNYITQGSTFTYDFNNIFAGSPGNDTGITYACVFDKVTDNAVNSGTNCTSLPGTASFNTSTGAISWTPDAAAFGAYEIKVTGTNVASGSNAKIFIVDVRPAYVTTNLRGNWDAMFADLTKAYSGANTAWKDLTSNANDGTLSSTSHASWDGDGTLTNPFSLSLDGSAYVDFGSATLASQTKLMFSTWINPGSASSTDKVIFGNSSDASGNGFTLRQSTSASKLDFLIGSTACTSASTLSNSTWYNVSGIYDGTTAKMYINGILECSVNVSSGFTSPATNLYLGATASNTKNWTGKIADLKIYGTSNGSAVGGEADVVTNYDKTLNRYPIAYTWIGAGGDSNWSNTANWVGGAVPGSTNIVYFSGACGSNCSVTIDVNASVKGIYISSTYPGTITQASTKTIAVGTSGWVQSGGTFTGGDSTITITGGSYSLTGGTFTSTSNNFTISNGSSASFTIFTLGSSGTFSHNSGTVTLSGYRDNALPTYSFSLGQTLNLNHFTVNFTTGSWGLPFLSVPAGQTLNILGTFTHSGGHLAGIYNLYGNLVVGSSTHFYNGGSGTIKFVGSSAQTYASSGGNTAGILINNVNGVTPAGGTTSLGISWGVFNLTAGSFTAPSGTFTINNGSSSSLTIFTVASGATFTHNSGTLALTGGLDNAVPTFSVSIAEKLYLNNLTVNYSSGSWGMISLSNATGQIIDVAGSFTHSSGGLTAGTYDLHGNLIVGSSTNGNCGGGATINFAGPSAQTYATSGGYTAGITINNSSGVTPAAATTLLKINGGYFNLASGSFTAPSGTFTILNSWSTNSTQNIFTAASGTTYTHNSGTLYISGSTSYAWPVLAFSLGQAVNLYHLTVDTYNNYGTTVSVPAGQILNIQGNLTHTQGALSGNYNLYGNLIIGNSTSNSSGGSGSINFVGSSGQTYASSGGYTAGIKIDNSNGVTPAAGTTALTINGGGYFNLASGSFTAPSGNFTIINNTQTNSTLPIFTTASGTTFTHNSGNLILTGSTSYASPVFSLTLGTPLELNNFTVNFWNNYATTVSLSSGTMNVNGTFTQTLGNINGSGFNLLGSLTQNGGAGNAAFTLTGTADQTWTRGSATNGATGNITINKASGTVTLGSNVNLSTSGQDLTLTSGTLNLNAKTLTVNDVFTIGASGTLTVNGGTYTPNTGAKFVNSGVVN